MSDRDKWLIERARLLIADIPHDANLPALAHELGDVVEEMEYRRATRAETVKA